MSDKKIDRVIEKVKKLLALGDASKNNSEAEAQSAMLKAQKLLAEYDLSIDSVMDDSIEDEIKTEYCEHKWNAKFRIPLATVLGKNFRCEPFLSGNVVAFMGHTVDVKICKETFEYAYSFIYKKACKAYNEVYALGYETKGVMNSYAEGFIVGLKQVLEQQCTALMLVTPPDVKEEYNKRMEGCTTRKVTRQDKVWRNQFEQGRKDGKDFMSRKQIEESS